MLTNNDDREISSRKRRSLNETNKNFMSMIKELAGEIESQGPA